MPPSNVLRSLWLSRSSVLTSTVPGGATTRIAARYAPGSRNTLAQRTLSTTRPSLADAAAESTQPKKQHQRQRQQPQQQQQRHQTEAEAEARLAEEEAARKAEEERKHQVKYGFPPGISMPQPRQYPHDVKIGTVTSVGLMDKTVRVSYRHRKWDAHIQKYYPHETTYLVSDPAGSLREGDVIEFSSGARRSPRVRHVVDRIVAPFGVGIDERPPVLTRAQREQVQVDKRMAKVTRKMGRMVDEVEARNDGKPIDEAELQAIKTQFLQRQFQEGRIKRLVRERLAAEEAK